MRKLFLKLFGIVTAKKLAKVAKSAEKKNREAEIFRLLRSIKNAAQEGRFSVNTEKLSDEDKQILVSKGFVLTMPRERDMDYIRIGW
jgi:hypothetical protein